MLLAFTGCDKKSDDKGNDNEPEPVVENKFAGVYELSVDYEVFIDGDESDPGSMGGLLTITATSDTTVSVVGVIEFGDGDATLYETTGTIVDGNMLRLEPSVYSQGASPINIYYYDIVYAEPLVFRTNMLTYLSGCQIEYDMWNTAVKYY